MSTVPVGENLEHVRGLIAAAAEAAGRPPANVRLVAVSKTVDCDRIGLAREAGQRDFGENRAQDLQRKSGLLPEDCRWHMIGHLQRNKVRAVVTCARWIHSVDSVPLVHRIGRIAGEEGRTPDILLQVNVSGEESKYGVEPSAAEAVLEAALGTANLNVRGLMTMAPFGAGSAACRRCFAGLRLLRDRLAGAFGCDLPELSMGMSADFSEAIAEGATLVRIGTAIFGARQP
jgi:pyridoxal phosphate enzyme (YggS family)